MDKNTIKRCPACKTIVSSPRNTTPVKQNKLKFCDDFCKENYYIEMGLPLPRNRQEASRDKYLRRETFNQLETYELKRFINKFLLNHEVETYKDYFNTLPFMKGYEIRYYNNDYSDDKRYIWIT